MTMCMTLKHCSVIATALHCAAARVASVTTTQLCPCSTKAHGQSVHKTVWMCSNESLWTPKLQFYTILTYHDTIFSLFFFMTWNCKKLLLVYRLYRNKRQAEGQQFAEPWPRGSVITLKRSLAVSHTSFTFIFISFPGEQNNCFNLFLSVPYFTAHYY